MSKTMSKASSNHPDADDSIADFAVAQAGKLGADYSEARFNNVVSSSFLYKNGDCQIGDSDIFSGMGVRLFVKGSQAFFSTTDLSKHNVLSMLKNAVSMASKSSKLGGQKTTLGDYKPCVMKYSAPQKEKVTDKDTSDKIDLLSSLDSLAVSLADVSGRYLSLSDEVAVETVINSDGGKVKSIIPKISFYYYLTVKKGHKSAQRFWQYGSSSGYEILKKWDLPNIISNEVKSMDFNLAKGLKPPKGKLDLVVGPQVVGIICHESCGHPFESDRILGREAAQAGGSFISKSMLGSRIGSDAVTVVDDPAVDQSFGFYLADAECVKARRRTLIKNGMINEFLHDRASAAQMNTVTNASSRASSFDRECIVRMANTFMLPGKYSEEELIEGVKHGVFMRNFMEWNIDDKRLNQKYVGQDAYLIKNGKLAGPVIRPALEINTPQLYSSVDACANNTEFHSGSCGKAEPMQAIPVWFGGPSIRIRNVRLS